MFKRKPQRTIVADKRAIERAARILGPSSASAKTLAEYKKRKEDGEDVEIYQQGEVLLVGPRVKSEKDA